MLKGKAIKIEDPLPEDLITEILSWLPVKALLQFKCVCRSWYAIITSQAFISKHLNNYYDNYDYDKPARETVLSVYHDSLALLTVHDIKDFLELHHQLKLRNRVIPISSPSRSRISGPIQVYSESKAMSEAKSLATELTSC
ncbi:hypothetical protein NC651_036189 [Populus alba x Populus x berolinensis]|nr:hypothetical protein NC651_036189 [Populus alba x Populus x berolinensis]